MSDSIYFKRGNWNAVVTPSDNEPYYVLDTNELNVGSGSALRGIGFISKPITPSTKRTFYVSPSGSYSATGLSPVEATTIRGAMDKAGGLVWNGLNSVVIQLSDGTYNVSESFIWENQWKNGPLHIWGNWSNPQNVVVNSSHAQSWNGIFGSNNAVLHIAGMSLQTSFPDTSDNYQVAVTAYLGGVVNCQNMRVGGVFRRHFNVGDNSTMIFDGSMNIYGKSRGECFCTYRNSQIMMYCTTVSFSNNPTIPTFIYCGEQSFFNNYNVTTFSGSHNVTQNYNVAAFSAIRSANQYPGSGPNTSTATTALFTA